MSRYTITLDGETLDQLRIALQVALLAPGTPGSEVPLAFDEAYYLEANPDVRAAVDDKIFRSGHEHYIRHGKAEGRRSTRPSAPLPVIDPTITVDATWYPAALYLTKDRLLADLEAHKFPNAVQVDGVFVRNGFGPTLQYWTWPDKSVETRKAPAPELRDTYDTLEDLLSHSQSIGWPWAIVVDGKPVKGGFDADNGASQYQSSYGRIKRVTS